MTVFPAITLPAPAQGWIERVASDFLHPPGMPAFDFAAPAGEPALAPHDGVAWRLFKNPLVLFVGGIAAVLLELAEPRIREGVWEHSRFRDDPLGRLRRTGLAAMVTVYGPRTKAAAMIAGVGRLHATIAGSTPEGRAYRADDPDLLAWVQATAAFAILTAHERFVAPLTAADRDHAYAEGVPAAALYGAPGAPASHAALLAFFDARRDDLAPTPIIFQFLEILRGTPVLPQPFRPLQPLLLKAAVDVLPIWVRSRLGLGSRWSLKAWERPLVTAMARTADRLILRDGPAVQSCRRLGLADDYLYRRTRGAGAARGLAPAQLTGGL